MVQVPNFGDGTRYELEILHQCGKRVKSKCRKVLGTSSYVCRSYRGKTVRGGFLSYPLPSPLNRVDRHIIHKKSLVYRKSLGNHFFKRFLVSPQFSCTILKNSSSFNQYNNFQIFHFSRHIVQAKFINYRKEVGGDNFLELLKILVAPLYVENS